MAMQHDKMCETNEGCEGRGMCGMGCHRHGAVRVLIAVIIIVFTFWAGAEFGELRASISPMHGGYGYGMMRGGWSDSGYGYSNVRMMAPIETTVSAPTAGPTSPTKPK